MQQARLPVKMGGLGLTAMTDTLDAACVGSWALCWHQMKEMCPQLFAHMDIVAYPLPAFKELRAAHATLQTTRRRMDAIYREIDAAYYDYDKAGEGHTQFHPEHLPPAHKLEPLTAYSERSKFHFGAQREYSLVIHHANWFNFMLRLRQSAPRREAVRFMSASQPYAGAFLNAVPRYAEYQVATPLLRVAVQRRLGLPLLEAAAAAGRRGRHGRLLDVLGDVAQNDGEEGHAARHHLVLEPNRMVAAQQGSITVKKSQNLTLAVSVGIYFGGPSGVWVLSGGLCVGFVGAGRGGFARGVRPFRPGSFFFWHGLHAHTICRSCTVTATARPVHACSAEPCAPGPCGWMDAK